MVHVEHFLKGLTPSQRTAAMAVDNPAGIIACAGSGKTKTMIARMAYLMLPKKAGGLGADPSSIFMVTFTNKAAREMMDRLKPVVEAVSEARGGRKETPRVGTFHSLCLQILRIEARKAGLGANFSIYDDSDATAVAKDAAETLKLQEFDIPQFFRDVELAKARALNYQLIAAKQLDIFMHENNPELEGQPLPQALRPWKNLLENGFKTPDFPQIYSEYQRTLEANNAVDFSDLINRTILLFREHPDVRRAWQSYVRHLIVDEAQDTNRSQFTLLNALFGKAEKFVVPEGMDTSSDVDTDAGQGHHAINLYRVQAFPRPTIALVGDPDQSIYGFRGAEGQIITKMLDHFQGSETYFLDRSFRCPKTVLAAGAAIVGRNAGRFPVEIRPANTDDCAPVYLKKFPRPEDEVRAIAARASRHIADGGDPGRMAVLTRSRAAQKGIAKGLRAHGIPVIEGKAAGMSDAAEIKDAMAFANFLVNPQADIQLARIMNKPRRGLAAGAVGKLRKNIALKERATGYRPSLFGEMETIAGQRIDIPEGGETYGKAMIVNVRQFVALVDMMKKDVASSENGGDALLRILERTGYLPDMRQSALLKVGKVDAPYKDLPPRAFLEALVADVREDNASQPDATDQDLEELADEAEGIEAISEFGRRLGNLAILIDQATQYENLADFVQQATLEMNAQASQAGVRVMTAHASKGLEFEVIWIPHMIQGLFPSKKAMEEGPHGIEEERRLFYVALTRSEGEATVSTSWNIRGCKYIFQKDSLPSDFFGSLRKLGPSVSFADVSSANHPDYEMAKFTLPEPKPSEELAEKPAQTLPQDKVDAWRNSSARNAPVALDPMEAAAPPMTDDEYEKMIEGPSAQDEPATDDQDAYTVDMWA